MSATQRLFAIDQLPQRLYLDTDFIIAALVATEQHHRRCADFMNRLASERVTTVYISAYSWIEYVHVVSQAKFRSKLAPALAQQFELGRWDRDRRARGAYLQYFTRLLGQMLSPFPRAVVPINATVAGRALGYMETYNLRGGDATHIASMYAVNVLDLASLDGIFRRVDGIFLWNDAIHPPLAPVERS